ncbi:MAG: hypothetical protein KF746_14045 [Chitinophagaceae bacterium]|nr:hypothetical protein [Chitinophagaceae bacterium]
MKQLSLILLLAAVISLLAKRSVAIVSALSAAIVIKHACRHSDAAQMCVEPKEYCGGRGLCQAFVLMLNICTTARQIPPSRKSD